MAVGIIKQHKNINNTLEEFHFELKNTSIKEINYIRGCTNLIYHAYLYHETLQATVLKDVETNVEQLRTKLDKFIQEKILKSL